MSDKSMEMSVRVASLEYLGLVAARLRRDSVQSRAKLSTMDAVVRDIRAEEEKDGTLAQVWPSHSAVYSGPNELCNVHNN